jgi:Outer membrane protein beta-barrel domain
MGNQCRGFVAAIALLFIALGGAAAQDAPRGLSLVRDGGRAGFWGGFGIGAGGEAFDLRDGAGYSEELYRPTISLRLGGTVNQSLRLGGEALAWIDEHDNTTESLTSLLFVGQFYPLETTGLYFKGGLGLGRNAVDFDDGGGVGDTGFAGLLGAGWEIRVGRRWYLNPAVDVVEHRYTGRGNERYRERLINFGLGVLFQSGR